MEQNNTATSMDELLPRDIRVVIAAFLDDRSKRFMRLANTQWFNLIKYDNFRLYFTRSESLPEITQRLSKYPWLISIALVKHRIDSVDKLVENISIITNLKKIEGFFPKSDASEESWMKLTTLRSIEEWQLSLTPRRLLNTFTNLKSCFSNEVDISQMNNMRYLDLDVEDGKDLPLTWIKNPSLLEGLTIRTYNTSEIVGLAALERFVNLQALQLDGNRPFKQIPLQMLTALEELRISIGSLQNRICLPPNLSSLILWCKGATPDQISDTCQTLPLLTKLHELRIWDPMENDSLIQLMAAIKKMTALEYLTIDFDDDIVTTDIFQHMPPSVRSLDIYHLHEILESILSLTALDSLRVSITRCCNHDILGQLTNLIFLNLALNDDAAQNDSDFSTIGRLTNLQHLHLDCLNEDRNFSQISKLTLLKYLTINGGSVNQPNVQNLVGLEDIDWYTITTQGDIDNLSNLSKLTKLVATLNLTSNCHFDSLVKIPLKCLEVSGVIDSESLWTNLVKITSLEDLLLDTIDSDDILATFTSLSKLTSLEVRSVDESFAGVYLTRLTSLQDIHITVSEESQIVCTKDDLESKLPFFRNFYTY